MSPRPDLTLRIYRLASALWRLVSGIAPDARGLFIAQGLSPADEVVVDGASALFAAEQNAAPGGR